MAVIALDLGGTKLTVAIFHESGKLSHRKYFPLEGRAGRTVGKLIADSIKEVCREAQPGCAGPGAVGVCVPGISHVKTGKVWAPNIPGWDDYPLRDEIEEAMKDKNIKVVVDNDRACSVLGERWKGAARECENVVFLAVGTGIGAGILTDGNVLRGAHDIAGAVGWMALDKPYYKKYDRCGCFEYYASGEGLVRAAKEFAEENKAYRGILLKGGFNTHDIFDAYESGDEVARKTIRRAIEFWGMAVANLVSIFNPEEIIFGGGVFGPALSFLPEIEKEASRWAQPISIGRVKMAGSLLGSDAALYGAAFQAFSAAGIMCSQ